MSTHKAHTLNITYKQHYAQVVDKFGDTWTRTTNGNGNWVWALGDYEEGAPIYGATQTGTLPTALEPYTLELLTYAEHSRIAISGYNPAEWKDPGNLPEGQEWCEDCGEGHPTENDPVNPGHYQGFSNGAEVIDITENLTFSAGNAVKYLSRAGRIDGQNKGNVLEDLRKAQWYVQREIDRVSNDG